MKLTGCGNADGFSLIEMLIAMALSLVLISAVVQLLIASQSSYQLLLQQARLQERARYALDFIVSDLRQVGYTGCGNQSMKVANAVTASSADHYTLNRTLAGWDGRGGLATKTLPNSDVIEFYLLPASGGMLVDSQTSSASSVTFDLVDGYQYDGEKLKGSVMAVVDSDCSNMALFASDEAADTLSTQVIANTSNTGDNRNCSSLLRGEFGCGLNGPTPVNGPEGGAYSVGSSIYPISHYGYGIRKEGTFDLWRIKVGNNERLVQGVKDLQIIYGLDTNNDQAVDQFVDADTIHDSLSTLSFTQVLSVNLTLTVSADSQVPGTEPLTADFSTTVYLRNRGLQ